MNSASDQVSDLVTLSDYIEKYLKVKKQFKNQTDRKKFLTEREVKMVKHPKTGEYMVPVEVGMKMLTGKRYSAARVKEEEHTGDRASAKEAFEKASGSITMQNKSNTKDRSIGQLD